MATLTAAPTSAAATADDRVVLLEQAQGIALIPRPTPLTRLNYFDGKFLRASDMTAEQDYHRRARQLAARAGGSGVVSGFELHVLAGDQIELAAGLAIDPEGRVLFMPQPAAVQVGDLIERSQGGTATAAAGGKAGGGAFTLCEAAVRAPTAPTVAGTTLYVLGIAHAEALCGQEDVFGKLCEEACVGGTERPQRLEGVVLRALPLQLATPLAASQAVPMTALHLRSRLASAYFADEAAQTASLISAPGLLSPLWCQGAAPAAGGFVPLAVLARAGGHTLFIDGWTARRERVDALPHRYWQWRMAMRPWDVFLAQVLQFQCQLRDGLAADPGGIDDPCAGLRRSVTEVGAVLAQIDQQYQATSRRLAATGSSETAAPAGDAVPISRTLLASALKAAGQATGGFVSTPTDRVLIRRGIVELPAAGYLPVAPGSAVSINDQVRRLLGEGVNLRFCVVRPDVVALALEEAQHMDRISLLRGLDHPGAPEKVDILVPDGQIVSGADATGMGWDLRLALPGDKLPGRLAATAYQRGVMTGAARSEALPEGALGFFFAGLVETESRSAALTALKQWAAGRDNGLEQTLWKSVALTQQPEAPTPAQATTPAPAPTASPKRAAKAAAVTAAPPTATAPAAAPPALAARYAALREQSIAYRLKTLERVGTRATASGIHHFEGLADAPDSDHVALWLALRADADPLAAAEGASVPVSLELSVLSPKTGGTQFVDVAVVGAQWLVESRVTQGQRLAVRGTLRGAAIVNGLVGTLANAQRGLQFSVPVLATAEPDGEDGSALRLEIDFSSLLFDGRGIVGIERLGVRVDVAPGGQKVSVALEVAAQQTTLALAARLRRNDDALKLGNPLRTASETAIDVLATRESAPAFARQARADLFGARPTQQDALVVRATRDWVLFHRRRDKQCGAAPSTAVAEPRHYALHHLHAKSEAQLRTARAAVVSADVAALRKAGFAPIGAAAFDGGRSTLATAAADLLQDWKDAAPGSALRFGAIGSQGAAEAEGEALAQARLATLETVLQAGHAEAGLENQVLPVLPAINLAGYDGAIFLVTLDTAAACQDVMRLAGLRDLESFAALASKSGLAAAVKQFNLAAIAHVEFLPDGRTITADSQAKLTAAWGGGAPQAGARVFHAGGADAEAAAVVQAAAIQAALGTAGAAPKPLAAANLAQATACAGLALLVAPEVAVKVQQVLVAWAPFDGRFIISANTPVESVRFEDGQPADAKAFSTAVAEMLRNQPVTLTTAVKTAAELAVTGPVKAAAEAEVKAQQHALRVSDTAVLGDIEMKAFEGRGFPAGSYDFALVFSTGRPGN